ncbi:phage major capsid protein [Rubinisphaera brasiliensis]|uniref:Phage major capsid protein, HK97 family n=1 Tax=Rubinisphaera brasiliensis (strain ATCC 49424 / DSM 5305 / JCM 21570 / IAM 15109 / NBRC 103401 / IFAM 1448) TaxID=756272 RepID=F0SQR3_RUBBR|nr:phage major capsid protein [Rubinisphaera brasiliensis]ADY59093.1 phage major capsid protein, HK97 family [Rubinisphaera brasiliensis DSM 5305]
MSNTWMERKALREQAQDLIGKAQGILENAHKVEKREALTPEENEKFEALHKDAESKIELARQMEKLLEAERSIEERIGREPIETPEPQAQPDERAFERFLRTGERRTLTKGTSNEGAEFVPQAFYDSYVHYLRELDTLLEAGAEEITTNNGQDLPIPTFDDTANTGELMHPEGSEVTDDDDDPATDSVILGAYAFSSKVVRLSVLLTQDSGYPIEQALSRALAERLADVQNHYFTLGTGTNQPQGVVGASSLGKTGSSTTAITYAEILDLIHSCPRQYRSNAKLMFSDATFLAIKKLVDGSGNPLWNAGNIAAGVAGTIDGFPYVINSKMADMEASAKSILFGDFSYYKIRRVNGAELLRFDDSAFMKKLQVGYMMWVRASSANTNSNAIKHFANGSGS